ncbi:MAG: hypothetical protein ACHQQ3_12825 [Gemmatimonadales bacterium]
MAPKDSLVNHDSTITVIPVAGRALTNIPEVHDCQRLLDSSSDAFGTLAGIWASEILDHLVDSLNTLKAALHRPMAISAAEIHSWDTTYVPLGIHTRFNCLYVYRDSGSGDKSATWSAWMVPVNWRAGDCLTNLDTVEAHSKGMALGMTPLRHVLGGDDVAATARWDWSSRPAHQYIGIKCGTQWCEVYNGATYASSPRLAVGGVPSSLFPSIPGLLVDAKKRQRVIEIKGWYDEERLAPNVGTTPMGTLATGIRAAVYPDPRLKDYTLGDFSDHVWLPAAYVHMPPGMGSTADRAAYLSKYAFDGGWNTVWLCPLDVTRCLAALQRARLPTVTAPTCLGTVDPSMGETRWFAIVVPRSGRAKAFCVTRRTFPGGVGLLGTVRWRWRADDHSLWMSCSSGCCELQT